MIRTVQNFEIPIHVRDSLLALFRPKDPDHLFIRGRRDEIKITVLYCNSAWLERFHNIQTELLDIFPSNKTSVEKLEAAALYAQYTRCILHLVKEFTAARYDSIRLSHTYGAAYAQSVEEFVSEIPSDFKSGADLRVEKALRQS